MVVLDCVFVFCFPLTAEITKLFLGRKLKINHYTPHKKMFVAAVRDPVILIPQGQYATTEHPRSKF